MLAQCINPSALAILVHLYNQRIKQQRNSRNIKPSTFFRTHVDPDMPTAKGGGGQNPGICPLTKAYTKLITTQQNASVRPPFNALEATTRVAICISSGQITPSALQPPASSGHNIEGGRRRMRCCGNGQASAPRVSVLSPAIVGSTRTTTCTRTNTRARTRTSTRTRNCYEYEY